MNKKSLIAFMTVAPPLAFAAAVEISEHMHPKSWELEDRQEFAPGWLTGVSAEAMALRYNDESYVTPTPADYYALPSIKYETPKVALEQ